MSRVRESGAKLGDGRYREELDCLDDWCRHLRAESYDECPESAVVRIESHRVKWQCTGSGLAKPLHGEPHSNAAPAP